MKHEEIVKNLEVNTALWRQAYVLWLDITTLTSLPQLADADGLADDQRFPEEQSVQMALRKGAAMARRVRSFAAVVMLLMLSSEAADAVPGASVPPMPLGVVLAGLLMFVNFVDPTRDPRVSQKVAVQRRSIELFLDALIVFVAIWLVGLNPASSLWVLLLFPIIQAVLRLQAKQMALCFTSLFGVYVGGEIWAASRYQDIEFGLLTTVQQVLVLLVVAVAAANHRQLNSVFCTVLNRRDSSDEQQERRRLPGDGFAVVYIDIAVADGLPSQMSPESMREVVAKRISGAVRLEDRVLTSDADAFVVLLEGLHDLMDATVVGERILKRLESPVSVGGRSVEVDPRVGVAYSPNRVGRPDELIEAAGRKAFGARRNGDDHLVIHDAGKHLESAVG